MAFPCCGLLRPDGELSPLLFPKSHSRKQLVTGMLRQLGELIGRKASASCLRSFSAASAEGLAAQLLKGETAPVKWVFLGAPGEFYSD